MLELIGPTSYENLSFHESLEAGLVTPDFTEPDPSILNTDSFRNMSVNEHIVYNVHSKSDPYRTRYIAGFGGVHSHNPEDPLFQASENAFGHFVLLTQGQEAECVVEGEVRGVDLSWPDKKIFETHTEIGRIEALARRAGIDVKGAEPNTLGLDALAKKYGCNHVLHYLSLRIVPQWYSLDPSQRPAVNEYIGQIFKSRPYLWRLRNLNQIRSYMTNLLVYGHHHTLPYDFKIPGREYCLEQTRLEHIVTVPKAQRTITQHVAFEFNLQRIRRLYTAVILSNKHVFFGYGDTHVRIVDEMLSQRADITKL